MIRAIFFDLDDTLLDRTSTIDAFLQTQHHRYVGDLVPYALYRERFHTLDQHGYANKTEVFTTLIAEFAILATAQALVTDFRERAWQTCHLFPDARAVLRELRTRGYRLGIITNGSVESQHAKLQATDLTALVDVALISAHEGVKKPDPTIFERAASRVELTPNDCLFVGDNPYTDISGAYNAGFTPVWYKRGFIWPSDLPSVAAYTIDQLNELLSLKL